MFDCIYSYLHSSHLFQNQKIYCQKKIFIKKKDLICSGPREYHKERSAWLGKMQKIYRK